MALYDKLKKMNFYRVYTYRNGKCYQCFINAKSKEDSKEKTYWLPEDDRKGIESGKQSFLISKPVFRAKLRAYALEEYYKSFNRYISGNGDEARYWNSINLPKKENAIDKIYELMLEGFRVKCGYFATKVRGYHDRKIFYKTY